MKFVIVMDEEQAALFEEFEQRLNDSADSFEVRAPRQGEAEGTYYRRGDGTLQIMGYSIPVPDALFEHQMACWALTVDG